MQLEMICKKRRWIAAVLNITSKCQLACEWCYSRNKRASSAFMDYAVFNPVLNVVNGFAKDKAVLYEFAGGEPTLSPLLQKMVRSIKSSAPHNLAVRISIVSNGIKFADEQFCDDLMQAGVDAVRLTVLSHDPFVHDNLTSCPGSHQKTVCGLENLLKKYPSSAGVNVVLNKSNLSTYHYTLLWLQDMGVKSIAANRAFCISGTNGNPLSYETYIEAFLGGLEMVDAKAVRLKSLAKIPFCRIPDRSLWPMFEHRCGLGDSLMVVEPGGEIIGCDFFPKQLCTVKNGS